MTGWPLSKKGKPMLGQYGLGFTANSNSRMRSPMGFGAGGPYSSYSTPTSSPTPQLSSYSQPALGQSQQTYWPEMQSQIDSRNMLRTWDGSDTPQMANTLSGGPLRQGFTPQGQTLQQRQQSLGLGGQAFDPNRVLGDGQYYNMAGDTYSAPNAAAGGGNPVSRADAQRLDNSSNVFGLWQNNQATPNLSFSNLQNGGFKFNNSAPSGPLGFLV